MEKTARNWQPHAAVLQSWNKIDDCNVIETLFILGKLPENNMR